MKKEKNLKRRLYGEHLTPTQVFRKFILPEIKNILYDYIWVDLFAGRGNLILPILDLVPKNERIMFFKEHIFLFDIQKEMVEYSIYNASKYGIPEEVAKQNIIQMDTLKSYPKFLLVKELPLYHITNPPYLNIHYIMKHKETQGYLEYFKGENEKYQDLYQIAIANDIRYGIKKMVYILPSNFLFKKINISSLREQIFTYYNVKKAFVFEKKVFDTTGIYTTLLFFERKEKQKKEDIKIEIVKIKDEIIKKMYVLSSRNHFNIENEFNIFVNNYKNPKPLEVSFNLLLKDVEKNKGNNKVEVINVNRFSGREYKRETIYVNDALYRKIKSNILYLRTIDTGSFNGRAGLYLIEELGVDSILLIEDRYRTYPIPLFLNPTISKEDQVLLRDYFNLILEYFRTKTDSDFLTTYKYSNSKYIRKYLGMTQTRKLIQTFPILTLKKNEKIILKELVDKKDAENVISFVEDHNKNNLMKYVNIITEQSG